MAWLCRQLMTGTIDTCLERNAANIDMRQDYLQTERSIIISNSNTLAVHPIEVK